VHSVKVKAGSHHIVPVPSLSSRAYLIEGRAGWVLVDALTNGRSRPIVDRLAQRGNGRSNPVSLILITHAHIDHYGGAPLLKRRLGAPIGIHRLDADDLRRGRNGHLHSRNLWESALKFSVSRMRTETIEPDVVLEGEEGDLRDHGLQAKWVRTPGHTEGSISVVFPGEVAIVGDLVIGRFGFSKKPAYPFWVRDAGQLRESVRRVLDLSPKTILSGHGGPFSADEVKRVFLK